MFTCKNKKKLSPHSLDSLKFESYDELNRAKQLCSFSKNLDRFSHNSGHKGLNLLYEPYKPKISDDLTLSTRLGYICPTIKNHLKMG